MVIFRRIPQTYPGYASQFFKHIVSGNWSNGPAITDFEKKFSEYTGSQFSICTSYGLHAFALILKYYGFNEKTEILIPGYTAVVVAMALDELKIPYRCVDIDFERGTMCAEDLRKKITPQTKGVLITHLLGNVCYESVFQVAREKGLVIIEDCAHSHGATLEGRHTGTLGHAGFYSFSYVKLMNTFTGGMLVTNDPLLSEFARAEIKMSPEQNRLQLLRKFFTGHIEIFLFHSGILRLMKPLMGSQKTTFFLRKLLRKLTRGKITNFTRYSHTQAVLGIQQLEKLPETLQKKKKRAEEIRRQTKLKFLGRRPGDVEYALIAVVPSAGKLKKDLLRKGIDSGHGEILVDLIRGGENLPQSRRAFEEYFQLPNYTALSDVEFHHMISVINSL